MTNIPDYSKLYINIDEQTQRKQNSVIKQICEVFGNWASYNSLSASAKAWITDNGTFSPPLGPLTVYMKDPPNNPNQGIVSGVSEFTTTSTGTNRTAGIYGASFGSAATTSTDVGLIRGGDFDGVLFSGAADQVTGVFAYSQVNGGVTPVMAGLTAECFSAGGAITAAYGVDVAFVGSTAPTAAGLHVASVGGSNGWGIITGSDPVELGGNANVVGSLTVTAPSGTRGPLGTIFGDTASFEYNATAGSAASFNMYANSVSNGAGFYIVKSRGTTRGDFTTVQTSDKIGGLAWGGATGSTIEEAGSLQMYVDGPVSAASVPGRLVLATVSTGATFDTERMRWDCKGNITVGTGAIGTGATAGFLYIPSCAGQPTGTPTAYSGRSPIVFDTTNKRFWLNDGSKWYGTVTLTTS